MDKTDKPTDNQIQNFTKLAQEAFALMERREINVTGFPSFYCRPLTAIDELQIAAFGIGNATSMGSQEAEECVLKMARFIVQRSIDENGERVFKNHDNQPAAQVLARALSLETLTEIIGQMKGPTDEVEELVGKSQAEDSES